jgi:predicted dehydrogenase
VKQIRQFYKDGSLEMADVPVPLPGSGEVLVRSHYSFVSVGTERMKVSQARMNVIEKAKERPDQVKQVIQTLRDQGIMPTYRKVTERLKAPTTLGYSTAGVIVEVGARIEDLRVGQRVAAIGEAVATHAEYNAVPRNMVVPVPDGVSLEHASATAIGAIALQGVRQARLELGETVGVIGLGLLGQFCVQLARANGCAVVGVDLDPAKCALAVQNGASAATSPDRDDALAAAQHASGGRGVDAVLLTASSKANDPVELSLAMLRDRGRIVSLGNTHIELDWRQFFAKEATVLFSRAMGPGSGDPDYERRGNDYPVGQVRWTQVRNMECFLDLLARKDIDLSALITHRFPFTEAETVFDGIADASLGAAVGIVFKYAHAEAPAPGASARVHTFDASAPPAPVRLGLIGAGNYAKSMLLPYLTDLPGVSLHGVCTSKGMNAEALAKRFGMHLATTDAAQLIGDPQITALLVATRHDSHAAYARQALAAGKHVYVEKPLALTQEQLDAVTGALNDRRRAAPSDAPTLWLGHNRRFAPLTRQVTAHFDGVPVRQVHILVHSGSVPSDSWYQDPSEGGGMLFGDVCHYIDLATWLAASVPVDVHAVATPDVSHREESWAIQIRYASGGIGNVHYVCGSTTGFDHDVVEVLGGGRAARMTDFRTLVLLGGRAKKSRRRLQPDLGQKAMLHEMAKQFARTGGATDHTDSFVLAAQTLLAAHRSIVERRVVTMGRTFPYRPE